MSPTGQIDISFSVEPKEPGSILTLTLLDATQLVEGRPLVSEARRVELTVVRQDGPAIEGRGETSLEARLQESAEAWRDVRVSLDIEGMLRIEEGGSLVSETSLGPLADIPLRIALEARGDTEVAIDDLRVRMPGLDACGALRPESLSCLFATRTIEAASGPCEPERIWPSLEDVGHRRNAGLLPDGGMTASSFCALSVTRAGELNALSSMDGRSWEIHSVELVAERGWTVRAASLVYDDRSYGWRAVVDVESDDPEETGFHILSNEHCNGAWIIEGTAPHQWIGGEPEITRRLSSPSLRLRRPFRGRVSTRPARRYDLFSIACVPESGVIDIFRALSETASDFDDQTPDDQTDVTSVEYTEAIGADERFVAFGDVDLLALGHTLERGAPAVELRITPTGGGAGVDTLYYDGYRNAPSIVLRSTGHPGTRDRDGVLHAAVAPTTDSPGALVIYDGLGGPGNEDPTTALTWGCFEVEGESVAACARNDTPSCGDGMCGGAESCRDCETDCGSCAGTELLVMGEALWTSSAPAAAYSTGPLLHWNGSEGGGLRTGLARITSGDTAALHFDVQLDLAIGCRLRIGLGSGALAPEEGGAFVDFASTDGTTARVTTISEGGVSEESSLIALDESAEQWWHVSLVRSVEGASASVRPLDHCPVPLDPTAPLGGAPAAGNLSTVWAVASGAGCDATIRELRVTEP